MTTRRQTILGRLLSFRKTEIFELGLSDKDILCYLNNEHHTTWKKWTAERFEDAKELFAKRGYVLKELPMVESKRRVFRAYVSFAKRLSFKNSVALSADAAPN